MKCADCGAEVQLLRTTTTGENIWGEPVEPPPGVDQKWDCCCRWEPGPEPGTTASVDYHYVQGETQRHFRAP